MVIQDPASNSTVADRVYRSMREDISTAALKPGERLVLRQLAKQFGTSNIPILEALRRLEGDGLTVSYPNAGAQVKVWHESDVKGAFLARQALEGVTSRLFAKQATDLDRAKLVEYARRFDEACVQGDVNGAIKLDIQLHLFIARCGNSQNFDMSNPPTLFRLAENSYIVARAVYSAYRDGSEVDVIRESVGSHAELVEALNSGNEDLSEQAAKQHVQQAIDGLLEVITRKSLQDL